jgi:electron transfer flavoprotein beta subunit
MIVLVCVEPAALGAGSRAALALASQLNAEVVAAAAGGTAPAPGLAEALRAGAGRAVHVTAQGLGGGQPGARARALALVARRLGADLVLAGATSDGEGRGLLGAAVAQELNAVYLARIESLSSSPENAKAAVVTVRAGGRKRRLEVPLPAVLTVGAYAPVAARPARDTGAAPETITGAELGLDLAGLPSLPLGSLERARRRPTSVKSADELLRKWLG